MPWQAFAKGKNTHAEGWEATLSPANQLLPKKQVGRVLAPFPCSEVHSRLFDNSYFDMINAFCLKKRHFSTVCTAMYCHGKLLFQVIVLFVGGHSL